MGDDIEKFLSALLSTVLEFFSGDLKGRSDQKADDAEADMDAAEKADSAASAVTPDTIGSMRDKY